MNTLQRLMSGNKAEFVNSIRGQLGGQFVQLEGSLCSNVKWLLIDRQLIRDINIDLGEGAMPLTALAADCWEVIPI